MLAHAYECQLSCVYGVEKLVLMKKEFRKPNLISYMYKENIQLICEETEIG